MIPSQRIVTVIMLLIFAASWIDPPWPLEQAMHSSLTLIGFALLWRFSARWRIGRRDFLLIALFLSVHSIAARWLYSNVPYDAWGQALFQVSIDRYFGWTRNHADRLVHFLYGLCFTPAAISYLVARRGLARRLGFYIAVSAVMITSLWYEWFEFAIAMGLSANDAEAYNGQQGDMWDAHKDMLMATVGSLLWAWPALRAAPDARPAPPDADVS
jgi:putative membrane protein